MRVLILTPVGGLANRIRAIEAAYSYAAKHSSVLKIIWEQNNILNASFSECFQPIADVQVINIDYSGYNFIPKVKRKIIPLLSEGILRISSFEKISDGVVRGNLEASLKPKPGDVFFNHLAQMHPKIHIETCYEFYSASFPGLVQLNVSIQEKAKSIIQDFTCLIGVHIRRTDNLVAIENSPLELYLKKMNAEISENPDVYFYVSTDSDEVMQNLKAEYKGKIVTGAVERRRDTKTGIMSALIDLYCLSRCCKILGSVYSSFSEQASKMGNVPLEIIKKD